MPCGSTGSIYITPAGPTRAIFHQPSEHSSNKGVGGSADLIHSGCLGLPQNEYAEPSFCIGGSHGSRSCWSRRFHDSGSGEMAELSIPQVHTDTPRATSVYFSSTRHSYSGLTFPPRGSCLEHFVVPCCTL